MTTPYIVITDAEIAPDKPVKSSIAHRLRDNLLAVVEGDPAAPSINPAIISQGGAAADGHFINSTTIGGLGWFDFDAMTITAPKTIPCATIIRINGNARLSDVLTIARRDIAAYVKTHPQNKQLQAMGVLTNDDQLGTTGAPGGSNAGRGSPATGGTAASQPVWDFTGLNRPWASKRPTIGGYGAALGIPGNGSGTDFGEPGGLIVLIVEGDFDCTGGTIDASGNPVDNTGAGANTPGSGSGGTIRVICMGTITGGTFKAASGAGLNGNAVGGGGFIDLIASAFVGTQTTDVTRSGSGTTTGATNGVATITTMTRDFIRTLISRWI